MDAGVDREGGAPEQPLHRRRRRNCASLSPEFDNPNGVPIDAILFGARRQRRVPLVYEARNWQHGTFLGATLSSETTAAATGKVGVLRRDPDGDAGRSAATTWATTSSTGSTWARS